MVVEWLKPFDEPTTVTVKLPALLELTVRVEDAEPFAGNVTLEALKERVGPAGDEEAKSPTVSVNPFTLETVSVEVADPPAAKLTDDGLADKVKVGVGGVFPVIVKPSLYDCPPVLTNLL